jgi:hypothetical protein
MASPAKKKAPREYPEGRSVAPGSIELSVFADPENTEFVDAGAITFGVEFRFLNKVDAQMRETEQVADFGVCVHVFAGGTDETQERLRFDCFEIKPHYHYINLRDGRNERRHLDTAACGDSYQWMMDCLKTRLPAMLIEAGDPEAARRLQQRDVEAALPKVDAWARTLARRAQTDWQGTMVLSGDAM